MNKPSHWLLAAAMLSGFCAHAQTLTMPAGLDKPAPSEALDAKAYRVDAARHIYRNYRPLIHQGQLPPLLQGVAILETTIDEEGAVEKIEVIREPAAKEITPWLVAMIQAAQPFPAAPRQGKVVYRDIWLVTSEGRFQLDAITEGQVHRSVAVAP